MNDKIFATPADGVTLIDTTGVRDLAPEVLDDRGRQRMMPASFYAQTTVADRAVFCVKHGIYGLVTNELVGFIREHIGGRTAIEIGSGDGVLARELGIQATDNFMQQQPQIRAHYETHGQAIVNYGRNVDNIDGVAAVIKYAPQVIVASWLTHKYKTEEHHLGGNMFAPDEVLLLANCETLIFIGNTSSHANHRLRTQLHQRTEPEWLYSRAVRGKNFVGVWKGGKG